MNCLNCRFYGKCKVFDDRVSGFFTDPPMASHLIGNNPNIHITPLGLQCDCFEIKAEGATVTIKDDVARKLLEEIDSQIDRCIDNPMFHGRAPGHLYEMQSALRAALPEGENK